MAGWKPIATAPRDRGRPLLLYPFPFPRGSSEAIEALRPSGGPRLDLTDATVRRMIKLAKKRGYVTYGELNKVLPSEKFSPEQIQDCRIASRKMLPSEFVASPKMLLVKAHAA
jgi:hypothetical protein